MLCIIVFWNRYLISQVVYVMSCISNGIRFNAFITYKNIKYDSLANLLRDIVYAYPLNSVFIIQYSKLSGRLSRVAI